jgi:hypothetical protein
VTPLRPLPLPASTPPTTTYHVEALKLPDNDELVPARPAAGDAADGVLGRAK